MSTTVRIREADKRTLDELQAKLTLATGQRVPLEEVLHRVLAVAREEEERILGAPRRLTEARKREIQGLAGVITLERDERSIDEILYGGPEGPA